MLIYLDLEEIIGLMERLICKVQENHFNYKGNEYLSPRGKSKEGIQRIESIQKLKEERKENSTEIKVQGVASAQSLKCSLSKL